MVKSKTMAGYDAPFVPGYDCHGLPIEIKVDEKLGHKKLSMPVRPPSRRACRAYAQKYVDLQTSQFERIWLLWPLQQKPYKTMSRDYEAHTLEAFAGFLEEGLHLPGPQAGLLVHPRPHRAGRGRGRVCEPHQPINLRALPADPPTSTPPSRHRQLAGRRVSTIIWTTTPWTLPASLAVAFHPDFDYVALETDSREVYIVAAALAEQVAAVVAQTLDSTKELARFKGAVLERVTFQHPFLDRSILGVLATYVTADTRHRRCPAAYPPTALTTSTPARALRARRPHTRASMPAATFTSRSRFLGIQAQPPAYDGLTVWKLLIPLSSPCWKSAAR